MSESQQGGTMIVQISRLELWLLRVANACMVASLAWIGVQFHTALLHIAEIRKELDVVRPADVLQAVHRIEKAALTRDQITAIVKTEAPFTVYNGESRLNMLETRTESLLEWRNAVTRDRWRRSDMQLWVRALKAVLGQDNIPPVEPIGQ